MESPLLAESAAYSWLPLSPNQSGVAFALYKRYCQRFGLPVGVLHGQAWLAIVEQESRKIAGVVGISFDPGTAALEVTGLYVYPNRRGLAALDATLGEIARLYDAGFVRLVCCHVLKGNKRMARAIRAHFNERGAEPKADLWVMGASKT